MLARAAGAPAVPMRRSELFVSFLVEAKNRPGAFDEDGASNEVRVLHHQIDRFLLRLRQRTLLPHGAARADEIEEAFRVDVLLQEFARRRLLVDVDFVDLDAGLRQNTSGVLARGSGGLPVKRRFRHGTIVKQPQRTWFDGLTMSARPEPFDSTLTLSSSKGERLAQDRLVEGCTLSALCG